MRHTRRLLRGAVVIAALAGALLGTAGQPVHAATWITGYTGAFSAQPPCEEHRLQVIQQEQEAGQGFAAWPCAFYSSYPGPGDPWWNGPGWYYRWSLAAD